MPAQILIVEDEQTIADSVVYALKTDGMTPRWVQTSEEAQAAIKETEFDRIILDVGLPDENGFELCKRIRKEHDTPVIFLTARSEEIDRIVGLEIGADDFVPKPFSPRELVARVKAILRRTQNQGISSPQTSFGPFEIDEKKMLVVYFGETLETSRYEFGLLKVFLERPGWVFSREQLMEQVWDSPEMSLDRTVDAHIKSLRAKLKKINPEVDPIVTHRGTGYSLRENW